MISPFAHCSYNPLHILITIFNFNIIIFYRKLMTFRKAKVINMGESVQLIGVYRHARYGLRTKKGEAIHFPFLLSLLSQPT